MPGAVTTRQAKCSESLRPVRTYTSDNRTGAEPRVFERSQAHVAKLEAIVDVLLQEIANGTAEFAADEIRSTLAEIQE